MDKIALLQPCSARMLVCQSGGSLEKMEVMVDIT